MGIFQWLADKITGFKTPVWLKALLNEIQNIIISTLVDIGKEYLKQLEEKICEVSEMSVSSDEKFDIVFSWAKNNIPNAKDAAINLAIEILVSVLKKRAFMSVVD